MMRTLRFGQSEATSFLKIFEKVDLDHSGTIDVFEFFTYFRLEASDFVRRSFEVLDFEKSGKSKGQLYYAEFFVSLYNYCTMTHDTLLRFTFDVMDADGSGDITRVELNQMIRMMHSDPVQVTMLTGRLMKIMDQDGDETVSYGEFVRVSAKLGSLMYVKEDAACA